MTDVSIPEPWHIDPDDRPGMEYNNHIIAANGNAVCFMAWSGDPYANEQHERAAELIAAAPDFYEAASLMIAAEDKGGEVWWRGFEMLKAAFQKAGGKFPSMDTAASGGRK